MSMVISASLAKAESVIVAALAAVSEVFSDASILSLVLSMVEPASLMSQISVEPVGAVLTVALTASRDA